MSNYHSTMRNAIPETTEWEDLQVKHGNWEAREKPEPPPEWAPREERSAKEKVEACDEAGDLSDLEDDFDDDRFMAQYREARLKELRMKEEAAARVKILPQGHGEPVFIKRDEFIKHVTEAEHGTWVVVFLFQNGHEGCELMSRCLTELSRKYVGTKFVKIISTDCIANYPDQLLPTLILYKDGKVQTTLEGLAKFGGKRVTPESKEEQERTYCNRCCSSLLPPHNKPKASHVASHFIFSSIGRIVDRWKAAIPYLDS